MYAIRPNFLIRALYPSALWRVKTKEKRLFLTFDDGPVPEITPRVLDTLRKFNAKATFFCVGENIDRHPEIFRQILAEGHSVGNHSYNHLKGWKTKTKAYVENIEKCSQAMKKGEGIRDKGLGLRDGGQGPLLFRPPYGRMTLRQFSILNSQFSIIMWDVLSGDFDASVSEEKCLKNVLSKTRKGSIVVFHDSQKAKKNLFYALPRVLEHFSKQGFAFECLPSRVGK